MKLCYNAVMKKFILLCLIFPCLSVYASELTEDYFDIAADYATYGKYNEAMVYVDKILQYYYSYYYLVINKTHIYF